MPTYEYKCPDHGEFDVFYKSLPSEAKQQGAPCPDCDKPSVRLLGSFSVVGTQHGGMEVVAGFAAQQADIGGRPRPVFRDVNGKVHEIKTSKDIDAWTTRNALGPPRMVEWTNPKTGVKSWQAQRVKMIADPVTGEPMDGPTVRTSEKLIPLDQKGEFVIPSESRTGCPIDPNTGVRKVRDLSKVPLRTNDGRQLIDPETRKPMTGGSFWGNDKAGTAPPPAAVKAVLDRRS